MQLDSAKLARLRNMSEAELKQFLRQAARQMGMSEMRAAILSSYAGKIKKKLDSVTEEELARVASAIGEENITKLLDQLPS